MEENRMDGQKRYKTRIQRNTEENQMKEREDNIGRKGRKQDGWIEKV